jgi:hypothetical protein
LTPVVRPFEHTVLELSPLNPYSIGARRAGS